VNSVQVGQEHVKTKAARPARPPFVGQHIRRLIAAFAMPPVLRECIEPQIMELKLRFITQSVPRLRPE
jgi:hypothetical protein